MLSYDVVVGADDITCIGVHADFADSPKVFQFSRTHALGTDRAAIVADLETFLRANSRTGHTLAEYKTEKMAFVDAECTRRILLGFSYAGKSFSFSIVGQVNLNGLKHARNRLVFPYRVSTQDNQDSYELVNVADCDAFYEAGFDHKAAALADCNIVKNTVRGAVDAAAVDTAVESYLTGGDP